MARSTLSLPWDDDNALLPLATLHRRIDQLFTEIGRDFPALSEDSGSFGFVPDAEVEENDSDVTLRLELPGVDPHAVDISVADRTIEVAGEKRAEARRRADGCFRSERRFGAFRRSFTFAFAIPADAVDARFDKGVLAIHIPKPPDAAQMARKVAIRS